MLCSRPASRFRPGLHVRFLSTPSLQRAPFRSERWRKARSTGRADKTTIHAVGATSRRHPVRAPSSQRHTLVFAGEPIAVPGDVPWVPPPKTERMADDTRDAMAAVKNAARACFEIDAPKRFGVGGCMATLPPRADIATDDSFVLKSMARLPSRCPTCRRLLTHTTMWRVPHSGDAVYTFTADCEQHGRVRQIDTLAPLIVPANFCPSHDRPLVCPACMAAKGGSSRSKAKLAAAAGASVAAAEKRRSCEPPKGHRG